MGAGESIAVHAVALLCRHAYETSIRAESDRPAARGQRAHGAVQLAAGPRSGRHLHRPHRGHRRRAIDARVGAGDPRRSALAGPRVERGRRGRRRARPVSADRAAAHLSRARRRAAVDRARVSLLLFGRAARGRSSGRRSKSGRPPKYAGRCRERLARRGAQADRERRGGRHSLSRARCRQRDVRRRRSRSRCRSTWTSSATSCCCARTASPPTTSPSSWTMR